MSIRLLGLSSLLSLLCRCDCELVDSHFCCCWSWSEEEVFGTTKANSGEYPLISVYSTGICLLSLIIPSVHINVLADMSAYSAIHYYTGLHYTTYCNTLQILTFTYFSWKLNYSLCCASVFLNAIHTSPFLWYILLLCPPSCVPHLPSAGRVRVRGWAS